jgi:hypothetical protein
MSMINTISTITCPGCGIAKPLSAFYADKTKSNGRRWICRACDLERSRAYYRGHREEKLAAVKAYRRRRTRSS